MIKVNGEILKHKKHIDLQDQGIREVVIDSFKLWGLLLDRNQITSFCIQAPNLRVLALTHNQLTHFTMHAPNLTLLGLSCNKLISFEIQAPKLNRLSLGGNPLSVLTLESSQVPELKFINLKDTLVKFIHPSLIHLNTEPGIQERAHPLGLREIIRSIFFKGHPVAEEICENIGE